MSHAQVTHADPASERPANSAWTHWRSNGNRRYIVFLFRVSCIVFRACNMTLMMQYFTVSSITHLRNAFCCYTFLGRLVKYSMHVLLTWSYHLPLERTLAVTGTVMPDCQVPVIHQLVSSLCKRCQAQIDGQFPLAFLPQTNVGYR